ncbi:MAG: hypothetical protein ACI4PQ_02125 [Butyricicoccaceae bacterium]
MEDFAQKSAELLEVIEHGMQVDFDIRRDWAYGGETFPLYASYFDDGTKVARLIPGTRRVAVMIEHCCYTRCETMDAETLQKYCDMLDDMVRNLVKPKRGHEYTFLSIVLLTDHMPLLLRRKLKKYQNEIDYGKKKHPGFGHSSARLCVLEVSSGKLFANGMGKALADRTQKYLRGELIKKRRSAEEQALEEYNRSDFGM